MTTTSEIGWERSTPDAPLNQLAVPMVARLGNEGRVSGTACLIAPYLAITAKHVMTSDFEDFAGREPKLVDAQSHNTIVYVMPTFETRKVRYIVKRYYYGPHTDIALLWLQPVDRDAPEHNWTKPYLRLTPPNRAPEYAWPVATCRYIARVRNTFLTWQRFGHSLELQ